MKIIRTRISSNESINAINGGSGMCIVSMHRWHRRINHRTANLANILLFNLMQSDGSVLVAISWVAGDCPQLKYQSHAHSELYLNFNCACACRVCPSNVCTMRMYQISSQLTQMKSIDRYTVHLRTTVVRHKSAAEHASLSLLSSSYHTKSIWVQSMAIAVHRYTANGKESRVPGSTVKYMRNKKVKSLPSWTSWSSMANICVNACVRRQ